MKDKVFRALKTQCCAWLLAVAALTTLYPSQSYAAEPTLQGYVMHVQMTPAVCALDRRIAKQRKCLEGYALTISGLIPETTAQNCRTNSSATLSPLQSKVVVRVMPEKNVRVQLWQEVGGCVPMNASQYFRTIINLAERLKIPAELTGYEDRNISQNELRTQFLRLNPALPSNGIRFSCQQAKDRHILTEIQVCYKANGQYKACSNQVQSNCPREFAIKGSY